MKTLRFVLTHAWRETRATPRRLLLLVAAIGVGVGALVAIESFTDNLQASVRAQARALLGADLSVTSRRPLSATAAKRVDSLPGVRARTVEFAGMAYVPRSAGSRLVQVTAVEGGYPFYGTITTAPADAWRTLQAGRHVLVEPSLLPALGAQLGDTLALGSGRFVITGTVLNAPGDVGVRAAFGARIFVPAQHLEATGLLGFGSRAEYATWVKLPTGTVAQPLADRLRADLRADRIRVRTVADDQSNLSDTLGRLTSYLGLVALIALLLGGIGVASAIVAHLRRKLETIAVLRCLGASGGLVFSVYLLQAALLGLVGSIAGALLGIAVQQLLPGVLKDFLPVDVPTGLSMRAVLLGVGAGVWVAVAFALPPLLSVRRVPPLAALRRDYLDRSLPADPLRLPAFGLIAASLVALASLEVGNVRTGLWFSAGIGGALAVLWLAAWALVRAVRRWFPSSWPYVWRQGLANLYRPANQTVLVVLSLGFGAFLLATLVVVQRVLLTQLEVRGGAARPNLVLVDLQPDQAPRARELVTAERLTLGAPVPIVPMRLLSVKGTPVSQLMGDTLSADSVPTRGGRQARSERGNAWAFRREYRSTYRDTTVASEALTQGRWWRGAHAQGDTAAVQISIEEGLAQEIGVTLGDEVTWDVQGVPLRTRVTSLRGVEWARFEPNFFVVFQPGALEQAPQSLVALTRVDDPAARGRLQRRLAETLPNVTTVDLAQIQQAVESLVNRVVLAIRFMALFSLATGAVVLAGAIGTTRDQRVREGALLKTIGATRGQILRVLAAEYLALGTLAAACAVGLSVAAGWALARFLFDSPFSVPAAPLAVLVGVVALGAVAVGLLNSLDAVRRPPLEVLRSE